MAMEVIETIDQLVFCLVHHEGRNAGAIFIMFAGVGMWVTMGVLERWLDGLWQRLLHLISRKVKEAAGTFNTTCRNLYATVTDWGKAMATKRERPRGTPSLWMRVARRVKNARAGH